MLIQAIYFLFVHVTLFSTGIVLVRKVGIFKRKPVLEVTLAYAVSIALYGIITAIYYIFAIDRSTTQYVSWVVVLAGLYIFLKDQMFRDFKTYRAPFIGVIALSMLSSAFIGLSFHAPYQKFPDPTYNATNNYDVLSVKALNNAQTRANDNYIPYRQAQFFVNRSDPKNDSFIEEWGVSFFQRTPLMGAVTAFYFNLFLDEVPINYTWSPTSTDNDNTYAKFQMIAHILNAIFILPAFFVIKKLFDKKVALISLCFFVTSHFYLYNSFFSWPKSMVAYFILAAWLFILQGDSTRNIVIAGLLSGLAYMTHDLAIMYISGALLYLFFTRRFGDMLRYLVPSLIFILPWMATAKYLYNMTSTFYLYPFSLKGIPQQNDTSIISTFFKTSPLTYLKIKLESINFLTTPHILLDPNSKQDLLTKIWAFGKFTWPGTVGLGLYIPSIFALFQKGQRLLLFSLVLMPVLSSTFIIGWPKGHGIFHFGQAMIAIATPAAIAYLLKKNMRRTIVVSFVIHIIYLVFFALYSFSFDLQGWVSTFSDIIYSLAIAGIVVSSFIVIHQVLTDSEKNFLSYFHRI